MFRFNFSASNSCILLTSGFFLIYASVALSHTGATGIVKQRMDSMKEMKSAMKSMAGLVKGEMPFDSERAYASLLTVERHAHKLLDYFPDTEESRTGSETEALAGIWATWDDFAFLAESLARDTGNLKQAGISGIDELTLRNGLKQITATCKNCHDDYRKP